MAEKQKEDDADLGGYYARDEHRGGFGDNYARDDEKERNIPEGAEREEPPQRPIGKASE